MSEKKINVVCVGYIGSVISVFLAQRGFEVTGIDKQEEVLNKTEWFNRYNDIGADEEELANIETSTNYEDLDGEISVLCVDTPVEEVSVDLTNIKSALRSLAENMESGHTIIIRSTLPPGRTRKELIPLIEEESGLEYKKGFNLSYAPEFVRGGKGLVDIENPSKVVVSGNKEAKQVFKKIFPKTNNFYETSIETAEAVKCFDNVFHGLKISLANESGRLGEEIGFDSNKVMDILASDQLLNISDMYMDPGAPYGGPCLSKDIGILDREAEKNNTEIPLISSINRSNSEHGQWIVNKIGDKDPSSIGLIGAAYKKDFNSKVNSPCLDIAAELEERGYSVKIHDPEVSINRFEQSEIDELKNADICVIFNQIDEVGKFKSEFGGDIIDLSYFEF